ncbi:PrgI family protein [Candidatus Gottesmanbacteria bacterium]|nr:PrgI family protein [Candidatus Gottesmanbacteria bacterium]
MEQHPVPQNVTTFQFRLIGDMTIKQFGYLASGILLAYIFYKLPLPFFFTWPLALIAGLGGFGLAFVPIEERPMDVWVLSFLKNVYSPTQFIWQKQKPTLEPIDAPSTLPKQAAPIQETQKIPSGVPLVMQDSPPGFRTDISQSTPQTQSIAQGVQTHSMGLKPSTESPFAKLLKTLFPYKNQKNLDKVALPVLPHQVSQPAKILSMYMFDPVGWLKKNLGIEPKRRTPVASTPFSNTLSNVSVTGYRPVMSSASPPQQHVVTPQQSATLNKNLVQPFEDKINTLEKELAAKTISESRIVELQKQLTEVLNQRSVMEQQLVELRKRLSTQARPLGVSQTAVPSVTPIRRQPTVRVVTSDLAPNMGLPRLTTFPNVVTGIIKDHEGNLLPGVLVTVRDKDDVPLRALKTNKLGQFAASTPLPSNTYFIEVEDPRNRYTFDRAQMTLNGGIVPTLEIIAKSQKQVDREKLAKEIFGNPTS